MLFVKDLDVYRGDLHVIQGLSLRVDKGEIVAVIGPNSAGKTTLLETIIGVMKPRSGSVFFMDRDITDLSSSDRVAMGLGCVLGREYLFQEMTVQENLELGTYASKPRTSLSESLEWVYTIFPALRALRKKKVRDTSGGEQQMTAIGRVLVGRPSLLMLDEPSSGLGPKIVALLFERIAEIVKGGTTILLVEQNVRQALKISNRAYVLESGKIVRESEAGLLLKDEMVRKSYLGV